MKLTIQRLASLTAQDRIDLAKVWPEIDIVQLEAQLSDTQRLYAARFNDRLLAALQLTLSGTQGKLPTSTFAKSRVDVAWGNTCWKRQSRRIAR